MTVKDTILSEIRQLENAGNKREQVRAILVPRYTQSSAFVMQQTERLPSAVDAKEAELAEVIKGQQRKEEELNKLKKELEDDNKEFEDKEAQLSVVTKKLEEAKSQLVSMKKDFDVVVEKLEKKERDSNATEGKTKQELEEEKKVLAGKQQELVLTQMEIEDTRSNLIISEKALVEAINQREATEKELSFKVNQSEDLKKELTGWVDKARTQESELIVAVSKIASVESELLVVKEEFVAKEKELNSVTEELKAKTKEVIVDGDLAYQKEEIERLESALVTLQTGLNAKQEQLKEKEAEELEIVRELNDKVRELSTLCSELSRRQGFSSWAVATISTGAVMSVGAMLATISWFGGGLTSAREVGARVTTALKEWGTPVKPPGPPRSFDGLDGGSKGASAFLPVAGRVDSFKELGVRDGAVTAETQQEPSPGASTPQSSSVVPSPSETGSTGSSALWILSPEVESSRRGAKFESVAAVVPQMARMREIYKRLSERDKEIFQLELQGTRPSELEGLLDRYDSSLPLASVVPPPVLSAEASSVGAGGCPEGEPTNGAEQPTTIALAGEGNHDNEITE